ncbi:MAG: amidohydrolase family protein [Methanomassiliicoccus sp.]|nr:amidohydrolase family protein [Methanomassiliicoccus sp.]
MHVLAGPSMVGGASVLKYPPSISRSMQYVSGQVLTPAGFREGHVGFEDGMVMEVGSGRAKENVAEGIILPTFINAHTHIADYVVPVDLSLTLAEVVAPPNGLKYRVLARTPESRQREAIALMSETMFRKGVSGFSDFREGGVEGARLMTSAKWARPSVLGKPRAPTFDREEIEELLKITEGIGPSAITDWDYEELRELSEFVRSRGKRFALHCSERIREDLDKVLDLQPSFLVHMTQATDADLERCAQLDVPVVVCTRSNMFFGMTPPLARMVRKGVTVALGTDNAMIALPDLFVEMEFAGRVLRQQGLDRLDCVLPMVTSHGRKIINQARVIEIEPGRPCDLMVVRSKHGDPLTDLVLRTAGEEPLLVCADGKTWRVTR